MTVVETRERLDQLVRDHLDLVYASALRQVQDPHLAADVTQAVFLVLQQKLPQMDDKVVMAAWLLRVTRTRVWMRRSARGGGPITRTRRRQCDRKKPRHAKTCRR